MHFKDNLIILSICTVLFLNSGCNNHKHISHKGRYKCSYNTFVFSSWFDKDFVEVFVDSNLVYSDTLSSEPILGIAGTYVIRKSNYQTITVIMNKNQVYSTDFDNKYSWIYVVNNPPGNLYIELRKKEIYLD